MPPMCFAGLPRSFRHGLVLCIWLAASLARASAEQTWREVRSPHFRVLTDGSEHDGRMVAHEFEQMRYAFSALLNRAEFQAGAPLTVIAARNESTFRELEPAAWKASDGHIAGLFRRGWEKQFALTRLDSWGDENQVVIYHEYSHSVLHANTHWLPTWVDEGLAEFYGYTRFEKNRILIGTPSRRMGALRTGTLIPVATLLTSRNPIMDHDDRQTQMFYAESWAMIHFMYFGNGPEGATKLSHFLSELGEQVPQEKAFRDVFGDPAAFEQRLSQYVRQFAFTAGVLPAGADVDLKSYPARELTPAETEYELGCYAIGAHQSAAGRSRIEKAVALDSKLAGPHEELGFLHFASAEDEDARKEWTQAVALDGSLTRSKFALIMTGKPLAEQSREELGASQAALAALTQESPRFAPPFVELALTDWRLGQVQQAYKDSLAAERLEPWRSGYRLLTGRILLRGNQPGVAAQYSRTIASHWFGSDHNEAVDLWTSVPADKRGDGPALVMEVPDGGQMVRGTLTDVSCPTAPSRRYAVTLQPDLPTGAKPLILASDKGVRIGFTDTLWWGEDHFSSCYHLTGQPVVAIFKAADGGTGTLLELEVRDSFPGTSSAAAAQAAPAGRTMAMQAASATQP